MMNLSPIKIAAVILNFNSELDLKLCAEQVAAQQGVSLSIILVDNASRPESVSEISSWLSSWRPDAISGTPEEVLAQVGRTPGAGAGAPGVFFVRNSENKGYSAGNNIGARLATLLGCEAVLIVNPDVRIKDPAYLLKLSSQLMSEENCVVAASAIYNLHGHNENPMRELKFVDELLLPLRNVLSLLGIRTKPIRPKDRKPCRQVSGSCLLVKCTFLHEIGYFDEGVFLYCEEAILSAQVRRAGKGIAYVPEVEALHAHQSAAKGARAKRTRIWMKSRDYYLQRYTTYGPLSRSLLRLSHHATLSLMRLKDALG